MHAQGLWVMVISRPRRMCEDYSSHSVCLSVTVLAATYIILYGVICLS